jgi:hypothetical protein
MSCDNLLALSFSPALLLSSTSPHFCECCFIVFLLALVFGSQVYSRLLYPHYPNSILLRESWPVCFVRLMFCKSVDLA